MRYSYYFLILIFFIFSSCTSIKKNKTDTVGNINQIKSIEILMPKLEKYSKYGNPKNYKVFGIKYITLNTHIGYSEKGIASWYGSKFHGKLTSTREVYDMYKLTAAHKTLPIPCYVKVTNLKNNKSLIVRVNDRGPFKKGRIIDLSYAAAHNLDIISRGTTKVSVEAIDAKNYQKENINFIKDKASDIINSSISIQVASFKEIKNAEKYLDFLFSLNINSKIKYNEDSFKIMIGPIKNKERLVEIKHILNQQGIFQYIIIGEHINEVLANNQYSFAAPNLDVESYALMDSRTGSIISGKNIDKRVEPASLTKIATLYLVFKSLESKYISENDFVVVSKKAWKMIGSRMFLEVGEKVQVKDLIQGVIVQSGNDASVVLAEHIAGGEEFFVTMLNKLSQDIGLKNTHFKNVTGLPDEDHFTSARDLATLSKILIEDFPEQYKRFSQKEYTYNSITQPNRNRLLRTYDLVDGIKTGHTNSAGFCLAASAELNNTRFITVIFGADSSKNRFQYSKILFKFGFRNFITERYFKKNEIIAKQRIWNGEDKYVEIGFNKDIFVTLLKNNDQKINPKINLISNIIAPIKINQKLGTVDFIKDNQVIATENIYSLKRIEEGNYYRKLYDFIVKFFREN